MALLGIPAGVMPVTTGHLTDMEYAAAQGRLAGNVRVAATSCAAANVEFGYCRRQDVKGGWKWPQQK